MATNLSEIKTDSNWGVEVPKINQNFQNIGVEIEKLKNTTDVKIRWATSLSELQSMVPNPFKGQYAYVGATLPAAIYKYNGSSWVNTGQTGGSATVDTNSTYSKSEIDSQQAAQNLRIDALENGLESLEEKTDTAIGNMALIDVDKEYPLGSGFYTANTARSAIPVSRRRKNLIITYKTSAAESVMEQFIGTDTAGWAVSSNWNMISQKIKHVPISEAEYEALQTKDENTLYYIFEE